jgi:hypothetical protein
VFSEVCYLDKAEIDVKENKVESLKMIEEFL